MDEAEYNRLAVVYKESTVDIHTMSREQWREYVVRRECKRMRCLIVLDLHPAYSDFDDFLCDYFPDFSWNQEEFVKDVNAVLADPYWQSLAADLKAGRGYDFVHELTQALNEADA